MARLRIIDAHLHCGIQKVRWPWEQVQPFLKDAGITGAGVMAPVEDIYDRYDFGFQDTPEWKLCRRRANLYVAGVRDAEITIYPYFFVWNDFAGEDLAPEFMGIKWHRHADEPEYHYDDPRCREFIDLATRRRLPILLEETFETTCRFILELAPAATVIIPHLGMLNGGYRRLEAAGIFALPRVYADTALAAPGEMQAYIDAHGWERLIFGSDFPFGRPAAELDKVLRLGLPAAATQAVLAENWLRCAEAISGGTAGESEKGGL